MPAADPHDDRILILATLGRDAQMLVEALAGAGFRAEPCASVPALVEVLRQGGAAIVASEEGLADVDRRLLIEAVQAQPPWSDIPVLVLTSADRAAEVPAVLVGEFKKLGNVTLLERPVRIMTLVTAVQSAVRARHRQYEVRDYVGQLEGLERQVRAWGLDLETANRRKDEFLAMLSHELRNPLNAIASAASILDLVTDAAQVGQVRDVIRRQIRHLTGILDDLLDLARITTGEIELHRHVLDLAGLVRRVIDPESEQRTRGRRVVVETVPTWVDGDETRLEQITVNLLTNALKYTPDGGTIHVHVGPEGDDATLRVSDTGIGIAGDRLPHIFELFYQGEQSLDRRQGGLGIGLTLVKQLVALHGGRITAKSDGIDCGSTFTVKLPRVAPAPPAQPERPKESPRVSRRVLIVEDNADSREMLRLALEIAGHQVFVAEDGPRGLEEAGALRPDTVFIDIGLPGLDGYEVARQLRQLPGGRNMCLVAVTGYGRPEDHQRSRQSGFDFHLVKPVDASAVERILTDTAT